MVDMKNTKPLSKKTFERYSAQVRSACDEAEALGNDYVRLGGAQVPGLVKRAPKPRPELTDEQRARIDARRAERKRYAR